MVSTVMLLCCLIIIPFLFLLFLQELSTSSTTLLFCYVLECSLDCICMTFISLCIKQLNLLFLSFLKLVIGSLSCNFVCEMLLDFYVGLLECKV